MKAAAESTTKAMESDHLEQAWRNGREHAVRSIPNRQSRNRIRTVVSRVSATRSSSLNAARRNAEIDRLAGGESVDLVVIGGGRPARASRSTPRPAGLCVALVERGDLAQW